MMFVLWVIALALIGCLGMLISLFMQGQVLGRSLMVQMKGLGETNLIGYEALTLQMNRLDDRVKKLENGGRR